MSSSELTSSWCSSGLSCSLRLFLDGVLSSLISSCNYTYAVLLVFSVFTPGFKLLKVNSLLGVAVSGTLKGLESCADLLGDNCGSSISCVVGYKSSCAKIVFYLGTFILLFI